VLEYLSRYQQRLRRECRRARAGRTGVGWVFQYALVDRSGGHSRPARSYQDWTLRYALQSVPGVAEVASIGGFVRQYQITVDPNRLAAYNIRSTWWSRRSRLEQRGRRRLLEFAGAEFMVRGRGYAHSVADFEQIVVKTGAGGVPVLLKDVARVQLGPEIRRGISDLDGLGDHVAASSSSAMERTR